MTMTNNMACVPKAESGTKCPKMTTPQYRCFRTSLTPPSNAKELSEKIRMLAMNTFRGGCYAVANV